MKILILILCLFTCGYVFAADFQVVSDFDDTIKVTNVGSAKSSICNTLLSTQVFKAMPELYQGFHEQGAPITIVSSGIIHIKFLMFDDLRKNNIPYDQIFMRHYLAEGTLNFKYTRLVQMLNKYRKPMVLIGDDTQVDADVYARFTREYPEYSLATYIRRVTGRPLPGKSRRIYTPYEIAIQEHSEGRMTLDRVKGIADSLLSENRVDQVFPNYVRCPKTFDDFGPLQLISHRDYELFNLSQRVMRHLISLCSAR